MSASDKKKLRKEQESGKLTEKQLAAQKEAKQVRLQTTVFVICMALILVVTIVVGICQVVMVIPVFKAFGLSLPGAGLALRSSMSTVSWKRRPQP